MPEHRHGVLLVDDDEDLLGALDVCLSLHGIAVHPARSGLEAFDAVRGGVKPCLVLLDLRMPDLDGWTVWETMRKMPGMADVPVVFLSGEPPDYGRAVDAGARAYLRKPVTDELLFQVVDRYCGGAYAVRAFA